MSSAKVAPILQFVGVNFHTHIFEDLCCSRIVQIEYVRKDSQPLICMSYFKYQIVFVASTRCVCVCVSIHLFFVVPDGATSILLQSGVVAASASVSANVVPYLQMWKDLLPPVLKKKMCPVKVKCISLNHPTFSFSIATKEIASPIL